MTTPGSVDVDTESGRTIRLRMATSLDRGALLAGFEHLDSGARYFRFFTAMPRLSESTLDTLMSLHPDRHIAVAAFDPSEPSEVGESDDGRGVGVGRLVRITRSPERAELTVTVIDEFRRCGVGIVLMEAIVVMAAQWDVGVLLAVVLTENRAMVGLARRFGGTLAPQGNEDATVRTYEIPVDVALERVSPERRAALDALRL